MTHHLKVVRYIQRNCTEGDYHLQNRNDGTHTSVKKCYATTQLPTLTFCGPNGKSHGVRGLSEYYHI